MAFLPSVFYMRKIRIISLLMSANAYSPYTAKRLDEIGLLNPYSFPALTIRMIKKNVISVTSEGKDYLCQ